LGDKPAGAKFRYLCGLQFWNVYRFWPDFLTPKTFSEKLWNRMLFDRNPILTLISDKLKVRDYVAQKVGSECLIPLLWYGDNPEEIPFDELPSKFVIKTNHGCGYNIIVKDKVKLDKKKTKLELKKWLTENYCEDKFIGISWGYKNINPCIIIESFIGQDEKPPVDFKFYCFSGKVEIVTLHIDRFGEYKTRAFNRNFEPLRFRESFKQWDGEFGRPLSFEKMVKLAELLAADFDFIRVDLYHIDGMVYFGELTPYPGGVSSLRGFDVLELNHVFGEKWKK
jgi:hypothetical protein